MADPPLVHASGKRLMWRRALVALAVIALLTTGLAIIVYVGLARDRFLPTPTPLPSLAARPSPAATTLPTHTQTPIPPATVVGIVREYSPGALIIVLTPIEGNVEQIIVTENATITLADGTRASASQIVPGETLFAEGTLDSLGRMIASSIVLTWGGERPTATVPIPTSTSIALPTPGPPPASPTPLPQRTWLGEYYANQSLSGAPSLVRTDPSVDFQWHLGSPAPGIPADRFSVRWRGRWPFQEGRHRFYARFDDGLRLWVNGALVIDQWRDQPAAVVYVDLPLPAGEHDLQVEYFDALGLAEVRVWWERQDLYPDWKAEYYADPDLAGEPALVRNDASIDFDWGAGSPAPQVPSDGFSVRWTQTRHFQEGAYLFHARADDGVRMSVDGVQIIDEWRLSPLESHLGYRWLARGPHSLRVEYFEAGGEARVRIWWEQLDAFAGWRGEYFANPELEGKPAFVRDDKAISFDWQHVSPGSGLPVDNFSVRWARTVALEGRRYRFWAIADDGVRLYVDGSLVIDDWRDAQARRCEGEVFVEEGSHSLVVEYYERGDRAVIEVGWDVVATATPSVTATPVPPTGTPVTPTATLTATPVTPTGTPVTPTATLTATPVTPTETPVTPTATLTATPVTPTETPVTPTATMRAPIKAPRPVSDLGARGP